LRPIQANRPDDWNGWLIHSHVHNKNLENYPLVNSPNKTINVSCELLDYKPVRIEYLINDLGKTKHLKKTPKNLKLGVIAKKIDGKQKIRSTGYLVFDLEDF
jgi:hypothetical protein